MRGFPQSAICQAIAKAPSTSPEFVPGAEVVKQLAMAEAKRVRVESSTPAATDAPRLESHTPQLNDDNPFLLLANKWEQESHDLGLDPDRCTPKHIAARRLRELGELLGGCCRDLNEAIRPESRKRAI